MMKLLEKIKAFSKRAKAKTGGGTAKKINEERPADTGLF